MDNNEKSYQLVSMHAMIPIDVAVAVPADVEDPERWAQEHVEFGDGHGEAKKAFDQEVCYQKECSEWFVPGGGTGWRRGDQTGNLDAEELTEAELEEAAERVPGFLGAMDGDGRLVARGDGLEVER